MWFILESSSLNLSLFWFSKVINQFIFFFIFIFLFYLFIELMLFFFSYYFAKSKPLSIGNGKYHLKNT